MTTTFERAPASILVPLLLMAVGFTANYVSVLILRVRAEIAARRLGALRLAQARAEAAAATGN